MVAGATERFVGAPANQAVRRPQQPRPYLFQCACASAADKTARLPVIGSNNVPERKAARPRGSILTDPSDPGATGVDFLLEMA
jgi:hypothetical protein